MTTMTYWQGSTNNERVGERTPLLSRYQMEGSSFVGISLLAACLVLGSFIGVYLLIVDGQNWEVRTIPYIYISRTAWRSQPPRNVKPLRPPVTDVYITYTNTTTCKDYESCMQLVRRMQILHMFQYNLTDIAYHFLVSEGGVVYEGRGWEAQNEMSHSNQTLSVAFIGTYQYTSPSKKQLQETKLLIDECVQWKQVLRCYNVIFDRHLLISEQSKSLFTKSRRC